MRVVLAERLSRRRSSLQMYWGRQAGRAAGCGWQRNTLHINTHKYQEYNQFKSDRDGYETRSLSTQQPSLNTRRKPLMRTPKEPAPTLKKGLKTGSFTTIFYMFLCVNFRSLVMTMEGAEMMITKAMMKKRKKEEETGGLMLVERGRRRGC